MASTSELQSNPEPLKKTPSRSESGHAKNTTNFDVLISRAAGYGTVYNPSKTSIKLPALQTLSTSSKNAVSAYNSLIPAYKIAVSAREIAFEPLNVLITRVLNFLKSSGTSVQMYNDGKTFARKIQGKRAKPKKTDEEKAAATAEGKEIKEISVSQMSYDNRLDNFDKLIKLLSSVTQYSPNENELRVTTLTTLYTDLRTKNTAVIAATTAIDTARITRNDILYKNVTGLYDVAADVKLYIKALFGASSPQYKEVSKIKFTKPR
jgi:hypothetical protein